MLGELVLEGQWKITGMRVLEDKRIELSFQENGRILGVEFSCIATVITTSGPNGTVYGEGQAVLTTKDGEAVSWKGMGIGKRSGQGMAVSYRGAKAFQTTSQKLAKTSFYPRHSSYDLEQMVLYDLLYVLSVKRKNRIAIIKIFIAYLGFRINYAFCCILP